MCYHITNVFDSWYFMKKGLLSGMKKRILRLINYIFVIAILFGGVSYAIIFCNLLVPLIERVTVPKSFGKKKPEKKAKEAA